MADEARGRQDGVLSGQEPQARLRQCPSCSSFFPADFKICPHDGAALGPGSGLTDVDPLIGAVLHNTYKIKRVAGEGGMARVYEAAHLRITGRRVAIKVLFAELSRLPEMVERFEREARAVASIKHPNVVEVWDFGTTQTGQPFIAEEFLEGIDAGVLLKRSPILEVPDKQRIVHRDLKPENLFLVGDISALNLKILDFGISKLAGTGENALTQTGAVLGTPAYMAPEQARGEKVDQRVDIFALGAILYRFLTGQRPFEGSDAASTIVSVLTSEPIRPRALNPLLPDGLELVIQKAMAKSPRERFSTMSEFDEELAPFDTGVGLQKSSLAALGGAGEATLRTDPEGETLVGGLAPSAATRTRSDVRFARPTILLVGIVAALSAAMGLANAAAAALRMLHGRELLMMESILIVVGVVAALSTPLFFLTREMLRTSWQNSARALITATLLRQVVFVALCIYGFSELAISFVSCVIEQNSVIEQWPGWNIVFFGAACVGAGIVLLVHFLRRLRA
ncbi:MAG: serine/threonine protein kinase [Myxococcota bacterium]|nr:serine/threonine protein kinase [Myxococcota bacterium]